MKTVNFSFRVFIGNEEGLTAAEYAIGAGLMAIAATAGFTTLQDSSSQTLSSVASMMSDSMSSSGNTLHDMNEDAVEQGSSEQISGTVDTQIDDFSDELIENEIADSNGDGFDNEDNISIENENGIESTDDNVIKDMIGDLTGSADKIVDQDGNDNDVDETIDDSIGSINDGFSDSETETANNSVNEVESQVIDAAGNAEQLEETHENVDRMKDQAAADIPTVSMPSALFGK